MSDPGQLLLEAIQALHEERTRLPEGAKLLKDISKEVGLSYDRTRKYLNQLIEEGKVTRFRAFKNKYYYIFKE